MNDLVDLATIAPVDEAMSDSLTSSAILFAATITALLLLSCLCTSVPFAPLELLFAVQPPPPESVRSRIHVSSFQRRRSSTGITARPRPRVARRT